MTYKYRFSIFTATYNRAKLLPELYECVKKQTFDHSDFEWVIVSDGSTDNTAVVVQEFIKEGFVNIKFINKENGGKHTAWREATKVFEGKYVISADDDDPIDSRILEIFDKYWAELEKRNDYDRFWEVKARCKHPDGSLVGDELPEDVFDSDYIEVNYRLNIKGEMEGCRKLEVLRNEAKVPENFMFHDKCSNYPEVLRWTKAARKYKTRYVSDRVRTYIVGHDSLCVSVKGKTRSEKRNYNSLVGSLYALNDNHDLLLRYQLSN